MVRRERFARCVLDAAAAFLARTGDVTGAERLRLLPAATACEAARLIDRGALLVPPCRRAGPAPLAADREYEHIANRLVAVLRARARHGPAERGEEPNVY